MKLSKWTLLLVAVMVTAALLPVAAKSQGNAAPAGNVNNGKELYLKYGCYACHGYTAQTGNGAHLVSTKPDQQAADLFAYIKTFKEPPAAKDIPLLNQILNEK